MPNVTHDEGQRERQRNKQVKVRVPEDDVGAFDEWFEAAGFDSRAEALRSVMREKSGSNGEHDTPLAPPSDDEDLRAAYEELLFLSNRNGIIVHEYASAQLASSLGMNKQVVNRRILHRLKNRGYLIGMGDFHGNRAWKIVRWDNE